LNNYTTPTSTTTHLNARIPVFVQGRRMAGPLAPLFDNSDLDVMYDQPVTLPAQSTLGCVYGRCTFCTYPAVEPVPTKLDLETAVGSVVEQAILRGNGTSMSIKDSLVTPLRLMQIASCVQQQQRQRGAVVPWSACTKLHPKLAELEFLQQLSRHGLATLEVGLESLLPETQRRIDKIQSQELFERVVETIRNVPEVSLVVYMTGFPWEQKLQGMT
jgi:radical SAM superfamily enzyme YgiQ (UPF0313 family)